MSRPLHRRVATLALLGALAVLTGGSEFDGCNTGERRPTGGRLPEGMGETCLVDADCPQVDMCVAMACVMRTCVESGPATDEDGDFFAPMPCGEDCDDGDPLAFPMATEICDGVDQDCDGRIDEGATGVRSVEIDAGIELARLVAVGDAFVLVGVRVGGVDAAVTAVRVESDGTTGAPVELVTGLDPDVRALDATPTAGGVLVVVAAGATEPAQRLVITDTPALLEGPSPVGALTQVTALAAFVHSGREHVLIDSDDPTPRRVLVRSDLMDEELSISTSPPALASDGALVAATSGAGTVRFFDPVSGDPAGSTELPGAFATRGLATGDGWIYAAFRDSFDHSLARVTPDGVMEPIGAPGGPGGSVELFGLPAELAMTRRDVNGVSVSVLNATLDSVVASFSPVNVSPIPGPAERVSAATTDGGLSALQLQYGTRSVLVFLDCQ